MTSAVQRLLDSDSGHRPRADAQRNVERLVAAAREAIADDGVTVTAHEIARRAGLGIGTFYRRLASREALLEAVLADLVDELVAAAAAGLADPDPWAGFAGFAERFAELRALSCGVNEALGGDHGLDLDPQLARLRDQLRSLVERGQRDGVLRADVEWADVAFVLGGVVTGDHTIGLPAADQQWRRNLRIVLDGLRPGHER
ncbi:TetR/AcrR family transcriptional regulator [Pseudonocardia spinosispora]|uniref:TetR/AcrR family transcriptional regulator n=1 Tax=Pseudonocardia spinosispora TaxID=103441 RepID=UPI00040E1166|nr:TetR/AcrR family transcriptional regulator [Pseudonocardia spinosispora]